MSNLTAQSAPTLERPRPGDESRLAERFGAPDQLGGIIESYELAFKMQDKVPELLNLSREPQHVLDAYGVKPGPEGRFARQ